MYKYYSKRLKIWSYITLFIASYTVLNVFIGFSSAPFYEKFNQCSTFDPDTRCLELQIKVRRLYISEFLGGAYMLVQGMIGIVLVDKLKNIKIVKLLKKSCHISLVVCMVAFILRALMYLDVHAAILKIDGHEHKDKGFGSFFAEYVDDTTGSVVLTIVLLSIFTLFYFSNLYIIKLMSRMIEFTNSQNEEYMIGQSILINNPNLRTIKGDLRIDVNTSMDDVPNNLGLVTPSSTYESADDQNSSE